jgi:hypothetical protein
MSKVAWNATAYGVFVAFRAASMAPAPDNNTRSLAADVLRVLRPHYESVGPVVLAALSNVLAPEYGARWDAVELLPLRRLVFSKAEWGWLKAAIAPAPESGATAAARLRSDSTMETAAEVPDEPPVAA